MLVRTLPSATPASVRLLLLVSDVARVSFPCHARTLGESSPSSLHCTKKCNITLLAKVIGKWELPKNIHWIANMHTGFARTPEYCCLTFSIIAIHSFACHEPS
jgi:hypothetical protein